MLFLPSLYKNHNMQVARGKRSAEKSKRIGRFARSDLKKREKSGEKSGKKMSGEKSGKKKSGEKKSGKKSGEKSGKKRSEKSGEKSDKKSGKKSDKKSDKKNATAELGLTSKRSIDTPLPSQLKEKPYDDYDFF